MRGIYSKSGGFHCLKSSIGLPDSLQDINVLWFWGIDLPDSKHQAVNPCSLLTKDPAKLAKSK